MKINEPLYPSFDQEAIEQARYGEAEVIAKMKSEFEDFVAQTRERLRLVSEALVELDRDFVHGPIEQSVGIEAEKTDLTDPSALVDEETTDDSSEPLGPPQSAIQDNGADPSQANAETDDLDVWPNDVRQSSNQSDGKESASKDASFPDSHTESIEASGNGSTRKHQDREVSESFRSSGDDETDPFERLNAIKERLARQIEKS
jgi:hypothetical protein